MGTRRLFQVDAFTRERFYGNPAGVVLGAEGLSEGEMQQIARELNNSETAFVLPAEGPDHEIRIRYFTPTVEVPICGHATIAAHYVRAKLAGGAGRSLRFKTGIGVLSADLIPEAGDWRVRFTQGPPSLGAVIAGVDRAEMLRALGVGESEVKSDLPIQIASTGHSKVLIPLKHKRTVDRLTPNLPELARLSARIGCNGYYPFSLEPVDPRVTAHGRMFAPAIGIAEDPVTGNAAGPLGAYLIHYRQVPWIAGRAQMTVRQGEAIHRTGEVRVEATQSSDQSVVIAISGDAVIVFEATI